MVLHSSFGAVAAETFDVELWSTAEVTGGMRSTAVEVKAFPEVTPFPYPTHDYLRRLNDGMWDARLRYRSRDTMYRLVRLQNMRAELKALLPLARLAARLGWAEPIEARLRRRLLQKERSPEATKLLGLRRPAVMLSTGPQRFEEPAVAASALRLGVPVLALITSWDNLTTKNRIPLQHDGFVVWSTRMAEELLAAYPDARSRPVWVTGAPQFDAFFLPQYQIDRVTHWRSEGLDPALPVVVYALGSPNFLKEHHGALAFARRVAAGELGEVQVLVRPHPVFDNGAEATLFQGLGPRVRLQRTGDASTAVAARSLAADGVSRWVNTFRHADVVVNLSSTATVDAAICDRPVVNLDFDPEPGQPNAALIRDINHAWPHFQPVAESGGVWLARDMDHVVAGVRAYLADPARDADRRRWIVEHVAGPVDGRAGARLAEALAAFVETRRAQ